MPEQAVQSHDALAPDVAREKHSDLAGGAAPAAAAGIHALVQPGLSAAGGRVPPAAVVSLQRRAGNRAVTSAVQGVTVQRDGGYRPPPLPDKELIRQGVDDQDIGKIK